MMTVSLSTTKTVTASATPERVHPAAFVRDVTGTVEPLDGPAGVAVDTAGNLQVVDALNDRIQIFDPEGNPLAILGAAGSGPGTTKRSNNLPDRLDRLECVSRGRRS